jgi:integrase
VSVSQLRDGRWICQYAQNGKMRREYFGRGHEGEARARARQDEIPTRNYNSRPRETSIYFDALTQLYLTAQAPQMQQTSANTLLNKLESRIMPALGDLPAIAMTPEIIDRYVAQRAASVKRTTIAGEITAIKAILRWGVRRGHLARDPLEGYIKPSRDDEIITPPSPEEVTRIWTVAAAHLKRIIALQWFIGLRPGREVLSLRWESVDFTAGSITIQSAKKGGLRSRRIALHPVLLAWMRAWEAVDRERGMPYIISFRGKRIRNPYTAWREAKRAAGITRRIRLYDLRHAFATALIMDGEDPRTVSKLMGHANVQTTLSTYTHATRAAQERAISRIPVIGNTMKELPEK